MSAVRRVSTTLSRPWGGLRGSDEPPVVRGWVPLLGCALQFGRDAPTFLQRCRERYGHAFSLHLLGRRMTFILDPRDYSLLFTHAHALSFDPIAREVSTRAFGYQSVYHSGLTEHQIRETYHHHLRPGTMGPLVQRTHQALGEAVPTLVDAQPVGHGGWRELELLDFVGRCIFMGGVVGMFGHGPVDAAMYEAFVRFDARFPQLVAGVPPRLLGTVRRDRDELVERLRPGWPDPSPFIEERSVSFRRYLDEVEAARVELSMLWASQANTTPAAFWALAYLLDHPAALAAVREELEPLVTRDAAGRATFDPNAAQPRLDSAIKETLRLCTGATTLRSVLEPLTLELHDGRRCALRRGDTVAVFPYLSHRDPEIFEEPEAFRYDRFLSADRGARQFHKGGQRLGFALMPFGGGETMCPGRFLALNEIKVLVTRLLADYELELGHRLPALDVSRSGFGILPPAGPLRVRLRPRTAGAP